MSWLTLGATIAASRVPGVHLQQLTLGRCNEYIVQELVPSTMSTLMATPHPNIHLALVRGLRRIHHSRSGLESVSGLSRPGPDQAPRCAGAGRREVREKSQAPPAPSTPTPTHTENCYPALREDDHEGRRASGCSPSMLLMAVVIVCCSLLLRRPYIVLYLARPGTIV